MGRTRIKVCGITTVEDALSAVDAGVDALGFVFYHKSPRYISPEDARAIIKRIPAFVSAVGLYVNESVEFVKSSSNLAGLDLLQFHGDETPEYCDSFDMKYLKAVRVKTTEDIDKAFDSYKHASGILLDAYVSGVPGGTGKSFDWQLIPGGLREKIILAGGLDPSNVHDAVSLIRPYAVDVSGGVEKSKGVKDHSLIKNFVKEVCRG